MKIQNTSGPVQISGASEQSNFSIAMNGKAFKVLSDTLYQNKIGSIVREISCNAYDSHISAGKPDTPFEIHVPDAFEPWFSVKDFGVGLSPEDIRTVFTVYFQSTKDNSNDTIGAFGLGAKTPFAYTDQFTVTSVKDGMKRIYSAFISESGVPNIVEMHSEESTEPSGVEIKLSAKREDYNTFKNEVKQQLRFFKTKPVVLNVDSGFQFTNDFEDPLFESENIVISSKSSWKDCHIVQGNVGYPIVYDFLKNKISSPVFSFLEKLNYVTLLKFDIGQIGVTASREGVEYDEVTLHNIENKLVQACEDVSAFFKKELDECSSDYEKAHKLTKNELLRRFCGIQKVGNYVIQGSGVYCEMEDFFKEEYWQTYVKTDGTSSKIQSVRAWAKFKAFSFWTRKAGNYTKNYQLCQKPDFIVIEDTKKYRASKLRHLYDTFCKERLTFYSVEPLFKNVDVNALKKHMGGFDHIIFLSDVVLEKKEKAKTSSTRSQIAKFYQYTDGLSVHHWKKRYDDLADVTEECAYVLVKDMSIMSNNDMQLLTGKYKLMESFMQILRPVYGIREKDEAKIKDKKNFVPLEKYVEHVKKTADISTIKKKLDRRQRIMELPIGVKNMMHNLGSQLTDDEKYGKIVKTYEEIMQSTELSTAERCKLNFCDYQPVNSKLYYKKYDRMKEKNSFIALLEYAYIEAKSYMKKQDIVKCLSIN